ncbi:hypothetical protein Q5752_001935 [Cryptotrichosporon argae]
MSPITYHDVALRSGVNMHYVAAGAHGDPTLLLLHGYPSSSNQFRTLIPRLATKFRVIAPDLPAFGDTTLAPGLRPTFALLAGAVGELLDALAITRFAMYVFDYGAPTGFRLALARPHAVAAIVSQNGNAYEAGLGAFWDPFKKWWDSGVDGLTDEPSRAAFRKAIGDLAAARAGYEQGAPKDRLDRIDPKAYTLDYYQNQSPPERIEHLVDLFWDYRTNIELYPKFHEYFKHSRVPVLAVWGKSDTIFVPAGAEAFKRDADATVVFIDGGHFLLETHVDEVAQCMHDFMKGIKW